GAAPSGPCARAGQAARWNRPSRLAPSISRPHVWLRPVARPRIIRDTTRPAPRVPMNQAASSPDLDQLTRFLIDRAGVRGVRVHLQDTWQHIRERASDVADNAPAAVELLGQASAAAALFTGHAKVDGRLSVQLRS